MQTPTFVRPFTAQKPAPGIAQHNEESAVEAEIIVGVVIAAAACFGVCSAGLSGNARDSHGLAVHLPTIHREDATEVADGLECGYETVYYEDSTTKNSPPEGLLHSHGLKDEPTTTDLCDAS